MYNIIYVILVIYFSKVMFIKLNEHRKSKKAKEKGSRRDFSVLKNKCKLVFDKYGKEKNNIFVFKAHKLEEIKVEKSVESFNISNKERQCALESAKYKCEICGNIANLDVYNDTDEIEVLCKKCHEEKVANMKLNYE